MISSRNEQKYYRLFILTAIKKPGSSTNVCRSRLRIRHSVRVECIDFAIVLFCEILSESMNVLV